MDARASLMLLQVQVPNFLSPGGTIPRRLGNIPNPTPNTTQPMPGCITFNILHFMHTFGF